MMDPDPIDDSKPVKLQACDIWPDQHPERTKKLSRCVDPDNDWHTKWSFDTVNQAELHKISVQATWGPLRKWRIVKDNIQYG